MNLLSAKQERLNQLNGDIMQISMMLDVDDLHPKVRKSLTKLYKLLVLTKRSLEHERI